MWLTPPVIWTSFKLTVFVHDCGHMYWTKLSDTRYLRCMNSYLCEPQIKWFETLDYWFSGIWYFGHVDIYNEWRTDDSLHFLIKRNVLLFLKLTIFKFLRWTNLCRGTFLSFFQVSLLCIISMFCNIVASLIWSEKQKFWNRQLMASS